MSLLLPSEIAKLAEAGGKTHAEAMKILKKENPDWPEGDLADAANSVSPSMGADARRVQKRYQALTKSASTESPMMLPSELARLGKFPAGVSMTIDEVAAVVGDSFKEMNENPPPEVVALREEMMDKAAAKRKMPAADMALVVKGKFPNAFVQLSGLFGDGAEDITAAVDGVAGFTGGRASVSDEAEAKALMEKVQKELSKNKTFKVSMTKDILDLPELTIKWAGKTASSGLERDILELMEHLTDIGDVPIKQGDLMKSLGLNASEKSGFVKALQALVASGDLKLGTKGYAKAARFEEGPEGAKQFDAWMAKQPKEVQDDWKKYTDENGDKFKTARLGRFAPRTSEDWARLGFRPLSTPEEGLEYWWKDNELYLVSADAYDDIFKHGDEVPLPLATAIARKGLWDFEDGFDKLGADAKRKPNLEAVKKLEGVVSVKMTPKREIVVVVENDIGNMASKYLTDKIAPILDQWDVDDSGFYRDAEDIPKGKKNQFTYTLKSGIGSKTARYEEGQPADPTAEMSPEDAKKWEGNTEKYKDKFTDEESMMDKFQGQLLPSESFSLMAAKTRHRSTWKNAEVEDDIGKKVKGPEESDKDEPYMKGQFTQVENSELSGKVAKGQKIYGHLVWLE